MKILITGSEGYIGHVLTNMVVEKGHEVIGIDTDYYRGCNFGYRDERKYTLINKDIRNIDETDLHEVDCICHLAALSNDPLGELNPDLTQEINFRASVSLAKKAKQVGVKRFLFSSSCSMYGKAKEESLTENAKMQPLTAYAKSKVETENALTKLANDDFSPILLRNSTVYGISPKLRLDLVLNNLTAYAFTTGKVVIKSDGTPWRPLVHVEDVARAFIAAIEAPLEKVHNEAFNVGQNEENYQIKDMADVVKDVIPGCEIEYTYEHGADSRTYNVCFDKIQETLEDFNPEWNIRDGVQELYQAFRRENLKIEEFQGGKYSRVKHLKSLIKSDDLDEALFWR